MKISFSIDLPKRWWYNNFEKLLKVKEMTGRIDSTFGNAGNSFEIELPEIVDNKTRSYSLLTEQLKKSFTGLPKNYVLRYGPYAIILFSALTSNVEFSGIEIFRTSKEYLNRFSKRLEKSEVDLARKVLFGLEDIQHNANVKKYVQDLGGEAGRLSDWDKNENFSLLKILQGCFLNVLPVFLTFFF